MRSWQPVSRNWLSNYPQCSGPTRADLGALFSPLAPFPTKMTGTCEEIEAASRPPSADHLCRGAARLCAGVDRAIQIVELALAKYGAPVYVRHEIVHNRHVVEAPEGQGAIFVEELDEIPTPTRRWSSRPTACRKAVPAGGASAQSVLSRRHLPAGLQGAHRGGAPLHDSGPRGRC